MSKTPTLREALCTAIATLERDGDEWQICDHLRAALAQPDELRLVELRDAAVNWLNPTDGSMAACVRLRAAVQSLTAPQPAAQPAPVAQPDEPVAWVRDQRGEFEGPQTLDPMFLLGSEDPGRGRHGATYSPTVLVSQPAPVAPMTAAELLEAIGARDLLPLTEGLCRKVEAAMAARCGRVLERPAQACTEADQA